MEQQQNNTFIMTKSSSTIIHSREVKHQKKSALFIDVAVVSLLLLVTTVATTTFVATVEATDPNMAPYRSRSVDPNKRTFKFGLCPKFVNNSYFDVARDGCVDRAQALVKLFPEEYDDIECAYIGHAEPGEYGDLQAEAILEALQKDSSIDGLSISVAGGDIEDSMVPVYEYCRSAGIPVVTFDADDIPKHRHYRHSYIGTDNFFMGQQMSKVLQKLHPVGGSYAILTSEAPNLKEREEGMQDILQADPNWIANQIVSYKGNNSAGLPLMREALEDDPSITAFLAVNAVAMGYDNWPEFVKEYPRTIFIAGDDSQFQLDYLKVNKVHGLVGQIPYEMGSLSIDTLLRLVKGAVGGDDDNDQDEDEDEVPEFIGTNVLEHLVVPLVLPELIVNENHLPLWTIILGIILIVTTCVTAGIFIAWTVYYRKLRVIQLAQPEFLIMVAVGCVVFSAVIIPLSMEEVNVVGSSAICMSSPWLLCLGFTTTFSALLAKTWRVNHVVHASRNFRRTTLTRMEVVKPSLVLFTANMIVLTVWTIVDPLLYVRKDAPGTDEWNRVIATYGQCQSDSSRNGGSGAGSLPYVVLLAIFNIGVLVVANYQAYQARYIDSEFSESQYIGIAMASLLQAAAVGGPVLLLVRDTNPIAWYMTCCFMIFFISFGILCLMFVPKIQAAIRPVGSTDTTWNGKSRLFGGSGNGSGENGQHLSRPLGSNGSGRSVEQLSLGEKQRMQREMHPFCVDDEISTGDITAKSPASLQKAKLFKANNEDNHGINDYEIPLSCKPDNDENLQRKQLEENKEISQQESSTKRLSLPVPSISTVPQCKSEETVDA